MTLRSYSPRTRQFDERPISRAQDNFMAGMFDDIPASNIPENGVAYLKNATNYGDRISGRRGSKIWGNYSTSTPSAGLPVLESNIESDTEDTIENGIRTVTKIGIGYVFTSDDVGRYLKVNDKWEEIIEVVSGWQVKTKTNNTYIKPVTSTNIYSLRDKVNGVYFHKRQKKIVLHIGDKLYVSSDLYVSSWVEIIPSTPFLLSNNPSNFDEYNNTVVIFDSDGIYSSDISSNTPYYHKTNADIPAFSTVGSYEDPDYETNTHVRRYLRSMSRYPDTSVNVDKLTSYPVLESGSNGYDDYGRDFFDVGVVKDDTFTDTDAFNEEVIWNIIPPITFDGGTCLIDTQWSTHSIYSTLNVSDNALAVGVTDNNIERYVWNDDVPVCIPLKLEYISDDGSIGHILKVIEGTVTKREIGTTFTIKTTLNIDTDDCVMASLSVRIIDVYTNGSGLFITVDDSAAFTPLINTDNSPIYPDPVGDAERITAGTLMVGSIGYGDSAYVDVEDGFITISNIRYSSPYDPLETTSFDGIHGYLTKSKTTTETIGFPEQIRKGTQLVLSSGRKVTVEQRNAKDIIKIYETDITETGTVIGFPRYKKSEGGVVVDLTETELVTYNNRAFYDQLSEDELRTRISVFPLYNRFYTALPSGNIGKIINGFGFVSTVDENKVYYSSIPDDYEYMFGYSHPTYQLFRIKDTIKGFGVVPDNLVVFGSNSTHTVPLNVTSERQLPDIGVTIPVISGQTEVDVNIGAFSQGGIQGSEKGKLVVITNEPAIRVFNGRQYSSNISSQRISKILKSVKSTFLSVYSTLTGFIFWMDE